MKVVEDLRKISSRIEMTYEARSYPDGVILMKSLSNETGSLPRVDPWGNKYFANRIIADKQQCFVVWSFGSDGIEGGQSKPELDVFKLGGCKLKEEKL
ncbi:hypothetical protein [Aliikangiella sp. IMCC44359]|uniref:hypothetical protein n=1 Tax=Aliikangiella sp. IMCC44359 TaxID=3459125 RepID=UPI00403AF919